jgi:hypothetical protein
MQINVLHDVIVAASDDLTNAYPLTAEAADGALVCMYRQGKEKHSYDGILLTRRSTDLGKTWSPAATLFDGRSLQPPQAAGSGGICRCGDGSLLVVFCATEVTRPDQYVFSDEGMAQRTRYLTALSTDHGMRWQSPRYLDDASLQRPLGPTSNPLVLDDQIVFVPGERHHHQGQLGICASFSRDHGRTLEPVRDLIVDQSAAVSYCDPRFTRFADGQILAMLWTFRQDDEETIEIHRSISDDGGVGWSAPQPVGFLGQITDPLAMAGDKLLAASNYRWPPDGIRLWLSHDRGRTWPVEESVQMWDAGEMRMLAGPRPIADRSQGEGVWNALPAFTFGTPNLKRLPDETLLLTYYAEVGSKAHVRACRFQIERL